MLDHQQRLQFPMLSTMFVGAQQRDGRMVPGSSTGDVLVNEASLSGQSVLLVEDSWHVAYALKSLLENVGMQVIGPAATLAEAERLIALQPTNLAVVDVNLQGELTYSLIERLHANGVPVVVISGYELLPTLRGQVAAILTKPIRAAVLLRVLRFIVEAPTTH